MRSPADMQIVLIDITNACSQGCSNCTRFCGNHKHNFFMDYETFKRAVDSYDGFEGLVAIIGGEPTLHPEFERFALYLQEKFGTFKDRERLYYPNDDFIVELLRREFDSHIYREHEDGTATFERSGPGLYSNMGPSYEKHFELIQDTFRVQFLNDHINPSYHQPGLFSRKDLGIRDEEWFKLRDACWLQNAWSASVTPKGAFFCEVAAALDTLFDGPGGWKIEPGWWKRKPEEFGDQLQWCELCGFALNTFMRASNEAQDDVSPLLYEMLKKIESPRLKAGRTNLVEIEGGRISEKSKASGKKFTATQKYVEHYEDRFNVSKSALLTKNFETVQIHRGELFGRQLNHALENTEDWILYLEHSDDNRKAEEAENTVKALIKTHILNPGTLHIGDGFKFFSKRAHSLKAFGYDQIAAANSFDEVASAWDPIKMVRLSDIENLKKWRCNSILSGKRYVIWGIGVAGSYFANAVKSSDGILVGIVDRDSAKWGGNYYGVKVQSPEMLLDMLDSFDYLLIGHYSLFAEIGREAEEMGIPSEKIIMPYEV